MFDFIAIALAFVLLLLAIPAVLIATLVINYAVMFIAKGAEGVRDIWSDTTVSKS